MASTKRVLTPGDVRAERGRQVPVISQESLAKELGWHTPTVVDIEIGRAQATQEQLQEMLDAVERVIAERKAVAK